MPQVGYDRQYGRNPYAGYDDPTGELLFNLPSSDTRLPVKVPRQHLDTFWFAWVAFHPETRVIG